MIDGITYIIKEIIHDPFMGTVFLVDDCSTRATLKLNNRNAQNIRKLVGDEKS